MSKYIVIWRDYEYIPLWSKIENHELTIAEMKKTWQFIKEYDFRFLAKSKAKYTFAIEHMIIREKNHDDISDKKYKELYELIEWFSISNYMCWKNAISTQTVPYLTHYHIAKFKKIDLDISKLS